MPRSAFFLVCLAALGACSYESAATFGNGSSDDDDVPGRPGAPGTSGDGGRAPGEPEPATCTNDRKDGSETDVDCGGSCDRKCSVGSGCVTGGDCVDLTCTGGTCQIPSGTDQVKNGDESDVDCGGTTTGAVRCPVGSACNLHADCASNGCKAAGVCAAAPSCIVHFGGDTCGAGDVGSGGEQHESCCETVPFPGYVASGHPNESVTIDRYEITAGRVREFVRRIAEENAGAPDIAGWIAAHRPANWNDAWTALLPSSFEQTPYGVYSAFSAYGEDNQGFHIHGMNCNQSAGQYAHSTYWLPGEVLQTYAGGQARAFTQDELDAKAMSCMTYVMAAAFCAWDGGQLVTYEALNALTAGGTALPNQNAGVIQIYSDSGNAFQEPFAYEGPHAGTDADSAGRVAAPGRVAADVFQGPGGGVWRDLAGNLNEMAMKESGGFRLMNDGADGAGSRFLGIGYHSATVTIPDSVIDNLSAMLQPHYKAGYSGARCMRFR